VSEEDNQFNEGTFSEASTLSGHGGPPSTPVHFKTGGTQTNVVEMVDSGTDAIDFDSEEAIAVPIVNGRRPRLTDKVNGVEEFVQIEGEEFLEKDSKENASGTLDQKPRENPNEDPGDHGQKWRLAPSQERVDAMEPVGAGLVAPVDKVLDDAMTITLSSTNPFPTPILPTILTIPLSSTSVSTTERLEPDRLPSDTTITTTTMEENKDQDRDVEKGLGRKMRGLWKCWFGAKRKK
jgi:hypothetical protein